MNCSECGQETKSRKIDHKYGECGLSNIILKKIDVFECTRCSEREIVIPSMYELHNKIATSIASKYTKLSGEEVRFLRSHLGFSGSDFARKIGVSPESVSRWENSAKPIIGPQSEKLLRVMVLANSGPFKDYEDLEKYGTEKSEPTSDQEPTGYENIDGEWNAA